MDSHNNILIIPGPPIALKRPRFFKNKAYDSQKKEKSGIRWLLKAKKLLTLTGPLLVTFAFNMPIASSLSKRQTDRLCVHHTSTPDIDNLIKFYLDCGNEILWHDDKQISELNATKKYSEKPETIISIHQIQE